MLVDKEDHIMHTTCTYMNTLLIKDKFMYISTL